MSSGRPPAPRVVTAPGPRACEEALFADLRATLPGSLSDLAADPSPVVVVVPSGSLRRHLLARLADRLGAVLGVDVVTLHRVASRIVELAGRNEPRGATLTDLLLRRAAARQGSLTRSLGDLEDGIDTARLSMRDLLDAGFEPELAPALDEALASGAPRDGAGERARALVRATAQAVLEQRRLGLGSVADLYRTARELLLERGPAALPARAILVHGFADATGVATDFLATLLSRAPARIHLDLTGPAPGSSAELPDHPFGRNFRERLVGAAALERAADAGGVEAIPPGTRAFTASSVRAEIREVGWRVLELLARGIPAEQVGVVARDLGAHALPLRTEWERLGIPFSGEGRVDAGGPRARRLAALLDLLERRGAAPVERWLVLRSAEGIAPFDLRAALFLLGASRLERAAEIDPARHLPAGDLPLPFREGIGAGSEARGPDAPRRRLPRAPLLAALDQARALAARLAGWPEQGTLADHLTALDRVRDLLALGPDLPGSLELEEALAALERECPHGFLLGRDEFARLLRESLSEALTTALGGAGAGVQVLDVTAARGRTFDHLFVVGLHAGSFPRNVSEDPVLPDRIRTLLAPLLPDLPRKLEGRDEERTLFAQLRLAAPEVVLSRPLFDPDGRPLTISPLLAGDPTLPWEATQPEDAAALAFTGPRELPPDEAAILAALDRPRADLAPLLAAALVTPSGEEHAEGFGRRARAHLAVLDEIDPDLRTAAGRERHATLGPYFGFLGQPELPSDPRRRGLAVTSLEALCTCPWRYFLERMLRLELPPDEAEELPSFEPSRLGRLVHAVLERLAPPEPSKTSPGPRSLAAAAARQEAEVTWPTEERLAAIALRRAERLLAEAGLTRWGLAHAEVARALPYLHAARQIDAGRCRLLGVEVEGEHEVAGGSAALRLSFRVDRLERLGDRLVLTDFKTGRPEGSYRSASGRRSGMMRALTSGRRVQATLYAQAARALGGDGGEPAATPPVGRYLFLAPDLPDEERESAVPADDEESAAALATVTATGHAALTAGTLFPRLLDSRLEKTADPCSSCRVAAACLQHDSGARLRLAARLGRLRTGERAPESAAEAALLALYDLGNPPGGGAE